MQLTLYSMCEDGKWTENSDPYTGDNKSALTNKLIKIYNSLCMRWQNTFNLKVTILCHLNQWLIKLTGGWPMKQQCQLVANL